mmetsp:Transcript_25727/g.42489  ORF Transcript_25727/g.42489 Transcript_25727/m.42489 type:complete len:822 (-) Transcript_25727:453-2918(-)
MPAFQECQRHMPMLLVSMLFYGSQVAAFSMHRLIGCPNPTGTKRPLCVMAVVEEQSVLQTNRRQPGSHGQKPVLILKNPRYAVRVKPQTRPPQPASALPRRQAKSPRVTNVPTSPITDDEILRVEDSASASSAPSAAPETDETERSGPRRRRDAPKKAEGRFSTQAEQDGPKSRGKAQAQKRSRKRRVDDDESSATMRAARRKKSARSMPVAPPVEDTGPVRIRLGETITVGELAEQLHVGVAEVVKDLMKQGVLASITQSIDSETATKVAEGFGAEIVHGDEGRMDEDESSAAEESWGVVELDDPPELLERRAPVVTVMGHVDHGKTSLLDALRASDVVASEAGGITQHIGASAVSLSSGDVVTFIDTPGHAAFSAMRSRGANVTDLVILVVAADDGVKEQTVSSIRAAKAASVPLIVAVNKVDKPNADPSKVKTELLEHEVVLEEFGGDVLSAEVSAKEGTGLDLLLEQVVLQAELLDLTANPNREAAGVVLEARQVLGQGAVATALVQKGTLRMGQIIVAGAQWGKVRRLQDARGEPIDAAGPSAAVELVGLNGLPCAGDAFIVTSEETKARQIAEVRQQMLRTKRTSSLFAARSSQDRESFLSGPKEGELPVHVLDLVVKSDVQGSAEALCSSLEELEVSDDKLRVKIRVLRSGAGAITAEDVMLASVSNAMVLGFNSVAARPTQDEAERNNVQIKQYSIVYDLLDDVRAKMATFIRPPPAKHLGTMIGTADVLQTFKIGAIGKVAGCRVLDGMVRTGSNIRILRGNSIEYEGKLLSLRSVKDEVDEIDAGNECGMSFESYQLMEPDDRVEAYAPVE